MEENLISRIKQIEAELVRRCAKGKIDLYNTGEIVHQKQVEFHKCDKKNRWVFGGNRTGKTECGAVESIWLCRGEHPFKKMEKACDGWVVSLSRQVQRDVAQSKILSYLKPE